MACDAHAGAIGRSHHIIGYSRMLCCSGWVLYSDRAGVSDPRYRPTDVCTKSTLVEFDNFFPRVNSRYDMGPFVGISPFILLVLHGGWFDHDRQLACDEPLAAFTRYIDGAAFRQRLAALAGDPNSAVRRVGGAVDGIFWRSVTGVAIG